MSSSLKSVRETLLYAYAEDIVDETEFMLLYDANKSTEIKFTPIGILKDSI